MNTLQTISIVCRWISNINLYKTHGYINYFIIPFIKKVYIISILNCYLNIFHASLKILLLME